MLRRMIPAVLLASVVLAAPAQAQDFEIHVFGGFRSGGGFAIDTAAFERLEVDEAGTLGAGIGYGITEAWQVEFIWSRGISDMKAKVTLGGGQVERFYDIIVDQFLGNVVYRFGDDETFVQFVFAGLGASRFDPEELGSEMRFSWDAGYGLSWKFNPNFGLRFQGRIVPSYMSADADLHCNDGDGTCLRDDVSEWMFLFEGTAGLIIMF